MSAESVTYTCGHDGEIDFGPSRYCRMSSKDRARRAEWIASKNVCSCCEEQRRAEENERAAAENAAAGLPPLTGSEKQVAWAETIRRHMLGEFRRLADLAGVEEKPTEAQRGALDAALAAFAAEHRAYWWIDHRDDRPERLLRDKIADIAKMGAPATAAAGPLPAEIAAEATLVPENPRSPLAAEVRLEADGVAAVYPAYDETFVEVVKRMGFRWQAKQRHWRFACGVTAGAPADRAAEAGHRLLAAGFRVTIFDPALRHAAAEGKYEPRWRRWVSRRPDGRLAVEWGRADDYYDAANKLPGARYEKPYVTVPPCSFEAILDFAERHGFRLSPGAHEAIAAARAAMEKELGVTPQPVIELPAGKAQAGIPKLTPPAAAEIDHDLRDDD